MLGAYKTTYVPPGPRVYPGPEAVRREMDLFKADFNARFKQVAFNSLCCAYYSTFIPCAFATVRCVEKTVNMCAKHWSVSLSLAICSFFSERTVLRSCIRGAPRHLDVRRLLRLVLCPMLPGRLSPRIPSDCQLRREVSQTEN